MITVKKDAIKYKDSEGNMRSAGVLCNVGTFGVDYLRYVTSWNQIFQNSIFEENAEISIDSKVIIGSVMSNMFAGAKNVKKIKLSATFSQYPITVNYMFANCLSVEEIDISNLNFQVYNAVSVLQGCASLKKIIGVIDFSKAINIQSFFRNVAKLEEVRFEKETLSLGVSFAQSPLLSDESIQSIIDGLATVEEAQTLTFHADVKAKLTDEQIATITSKNWTLA